MMRKSKTRKPPAEASCETSEAVKNAAAPDEADAVDAKDQARSSKESVDWPAKVEKLEDALLRAKADFQNLQRRATAERAETIRFANADLIRSLLGVIDDLGRALASTEATGTSDPMVQGVRIVHANLLAVLQAQGVERIEALHRPFDPSVHEAVLQQPSNEHPPGTVLEEVAAGYRLHHRLLRPARVVVSKTTDDAPREETGEGDKSEAPCDQIDAASTQDQAAD